MKNVSLLVIGIAMGWTLSHMTGGFPHGKAVAKVSEVELTAEISEEDALKAAFVGNSGAQQRGPASIEETQKLDSTIAPAEIYATDSNSEKPILDLTALSAAEKQSLINALQATLPENIDEDQLREARVQLEAEQLATPEEKLKLKVEQDKAEEDRRREAIISLFN